MSFVRRENATQFLPMSREEMEARGWDYVDVVFVTGDAYVDHPSFAVALLGRLMQAEGYRVAILSQPDWHSCEPWRQFGRPRLCFAISAGNMDSMVNRYTANKKVRNDDAYSPGGRTGMRPDRATLAYCQRAREAFKDVPIIAGGVEASLRRIAHYDYWSDKVRRSILLDAKADLLVYGMGERPILEILARLARGEKVKELRDIRGTVYRLGASESAPDDALVLPSFEEVVADKLAFARMTKMAHLETNPYNARRLIQYHGREAVVVNPPAFPLTEAEMDRIYSLPYLRRPHPKYGDDPIPAYEVVKHSVQIMRGCFGGCTFCAIAAHEGRIVQSRSPKSILAEIDRMKEDPAFKGVISDLGGPTANMYRMNCSRPEVQAKCRRLSCLHPTVCKMLNTDHGPLIDLIKRVRKVKGIERVFVASGVRTDLAQLSHDYLNELVRYHVGGHLKVAPEHCDNGVLRLMKKPTIEDFERFATAFHQLSHAAGKEQYLVPYFISGHPGCDLNAMIRLAEFLKRTGYRPQQVQDFMPTPFNIATCMYYTGMDPFSGENVYVPKGEHERRLQRALLQFWKPENYFDVREALRLAGRTDLIGNGPDCLIPSRPPKGAVRLGINKDRRQSKSTSTATSEHKARETRSSPAGYRPHRASFRRRPLP